MTSTYTQPVFTLIEGKMKLQIDKKCLQAAVIFFSLVPLLAGVFGALSGLRFSGGLATLDADSHFRYMSGLLLGIGLAYCSCVPNIETKTQRFQLLTFIVFIGGLARLLGALMAGWPGKPMMFGLVMELAVTPALCLWQGNIAKRFSSFSACKPEFPE